MPSAGFSGFLPHPALAAEHGDRADDRPGEPEGPSQRVGSLPRAVHLREIDAGRHRHHARRGNAGGDHDAPDGLAARDDPVREPAVDGIQPTPDADGHVAGSDHGYPRNSRGQPADPAVHRAMGVDEADAFVAHEPRKARHRAQIPGSAHRHLDDVDPELPRALREGGARLAGQEHPPSALGYPAGLGQGADFLAAQARRRLRVEDGPHAAGPSPSAARAAAATTDGSIDRMHG